MDDLSADGVRTAQPEGPHAYTASRTLKAAVLAEADLFGRQDSRGRESARLVSRRRLRHPRHHCRAVDGIDHRLLRQRSQARLLPFARIPDRPPPVRCDDQSRDRRADGGGAEGARREPRRIAPDRAGRSARQRRPWTSRGLFHGQHGDARNRRPRLWHSLRQRALPADHPERMAAGSARGLAYPRQSVGVRAA